MRSLVRTLTRGLLALAAVGLAVVVAELSVRVLDPFGISYYQDTGRYIREAIVLLPADVVDARSRIFNNRPQLDLELETFRLATDNLGLRAPSPDRVTEPRAADGERTHRRILFLGDSVTLGWGVDDARTWVRRLERTERGVDGRPLECLNAGHLQYNTAQEADLLSVLGPLLRPDAVVVTFVTNDLTDDPFGSYTALMAALGAPAAATGLAAELDRLRAETYAWFWGLRGVAEYRKNVAAEPAVDAPVPAVEELPGYDAGWERVRGGLERILEQCRAMGAPLVVLDHGNPAVDAVEAWCREAGVAWYPFAFTEEEWASGVRLSPADAHADARGNELLFHKARRALVDAGQLAARDGS